MNRPAGAAVLLPSVLIALLPGAAPARAVGHGSLTTTVSGVPTRSPPAGASPGCPWVPWQRAATDSARVEPSATSCPVRPAIRSPGTAPRPHPAGPAVLHLRLGERWRVPRPGGIPAAAEPSPSRTGTVLVATSSSGTTVAPLALGIAAFLAAAAVGTVAVLCRCRVERGGPADGWASHRAGLSPDAPSRRDRPAGHGCPIADPHPGNDPHSRNGGTGNLRVSDNRTTGTTIPANSWRATGHAGCVPARKGRGIRSVYRRIVTICHACRDGRSDARPEALPANLIVNHGRRRVRTERAARRDARMRRDDRRPEGMQDEADGPLRLHSPVRFRPSRPARRAHAATEVSEP